MLSNINPSYYGSRLKSSCRESSCRQLSRKPHRTDSAYSLLEVMVTMVVLSTILSALITSVATLRQSQVSSESSERVADIVHLIHERLVATPYNQLGATAWTIERQVGGDNYMTDDPSSGEGRNLVKNDQGTSLGLLNQVTGLKDFKIYLEYYFAFDTEIYGVSYIGLADQDNSETNGYTAEMLEKSRLTVPVTDLNGAPVIIRLVVSWESRQWETYLARRAL